MNRTTKTDWLVPAGLLFLCAVPAVAGAIRLIQLSTGAEITAENARFFDQPLPAVLHIISSLIYCIVGAFQFSPGLRRRSPYWHRMSGRMLVPTGLVAALSALWMTQYYPGANFDGTAVYVLRLVVGVGMAMSLCLGLFFIVGRDIGNHRAWMMRAYALGLGAGTQAFTHIPWFLFPDIQGELVRALCMGAGWLINIAVAEWLIMRVSGKQSAPTGALAGE
jgi:hypothetical protein